MQYVQLYPISYKPIDLTNFGEIENVTKISSVKAVSKGEETISRYVTGSAAVNSEPESVEHILQIRDEADRRHSCRRVTSTPLAEELRSDVRRRHNNQRQQDIKTAIDEMA